MRELIAFCEQFQECLDTSAFSKTNFARSFWELRCDLKESAVPVDQFEASIKAWLEKALELVSPSGKIRSIVSEYKNKLLAINTAKPAANPPKIVINERTVADEICAPLQEYLKSQSASQFLLDSFEAQYKRVRQHKMQNNVVAITRSFLSWIKMNRGDMNSANMKTERVLAEMGIKLVMDALNRTKELPDVQKQLNGYLKKFERRQKRIERTLKKLSAIESAPAPVKSLSDEEFFAEIEKTMKVEQEKTPQLFYRSKSGFFADFDEAPAFLAKLPQEVAGESEDSVDTESQDELSGSFTADSMNDVSEIVLPSVPTKEELSAEIKSKENEMTNLQIEKTRRIQPEKSILAALSQKTLSLKMDLATEHQENYIAANVARNEKTKEAVLQQIVKKGFLDYLLFFMGGTADYKKRKAACKTYLDTATAEAQIKTGLKENNKILAQHWLEPAFADVGNVKKNVADFFMERAEREKRLPEIETKQKELQAEIKRLKFKLDVIQSCEKKAVAVPRANSPALPIAANLSQ